MSTLESFLCGRWVSGAGRPATLVNPSTEEPLAEASTEGLDFGAALEHARHRGGPALRAMTFGERGALLKSLASAVHAKRDELLDLAMRNGGNTRGDAKFDVDGAAGTLGAYAELGASLGDARALLDGDAVNLGRSSRLAGQHVLTPRHGVAVHVNAFNFPAWGLAEKAAQALLAGMPVITKPATATALVAHRMVQLLVDSGALPDGALQLVTGGAGDLIDRLGSQDVLAFTGAGSTGMMLRGKVNLLAASTHVNVEADSLNAAVLGPDVERGSDTWDLFVADVVRDMTQKTGQKCTAIRRVFVPAAMLDAAQEDLSDRLSACRVGNVLADGVTMGPVSTAAQLRDARAGIERLAASGARVVLGGAAAVQGVGAPEGKGYFVAPTLLRLDDNTRGDDVHEHEVFAPVATLIPYGSVPEAVALVHRGGGSLVSSVYTDDRAVAAEVALGVASSNGRVCVVSAKVAGAWLGPGAVLPQLLHGGPGRAGGGEELGGLRGVSLYLQRTALQGYGPLLEHITAGARRVG